MRIKDLKSKLQKEMDAIVPDVFASVKKVPITNLLPHGSREQQLRQKIIMRMLFATCCMFFSVLLVSAAFLMSNYTHPPERASMTYINMYVAPAVGDGVDAEDSNAFEINFIVNLDNTVRLAELNPVAINEIMDGLVLRNRHFKEVVVDIMKKGYALGWFDAGESSIVVITSLNHVDGVAKQLREEATVTLNNYFENKNRQVSMSAYDGEKAQLYAWSHSKNQNARPDMGIEELIYLMDIARYQ